MFNHVAIAAFAVPRTMVESLLPSDGDLVPDDPHPDLGVGNDSAVVSLAGMSAEHMRLWGIKWPGRSRYIELALRLHVRQADRRGVLNVRRYNSSGLWTWAAGRIFGEDCRKQEIAERLSQQPRAIRIEHRIKFVPPMVIPGPGQVARPDGTPGEFSLTIEAQKPVVRPDPRGVEHWLKETRWVFTPSLSGPGPTRPAAAPAPTLGGVMVHEVLHPLWSVFPTPSVRVQIDFANLFGLDWGFLNGSQPIGACLALGSQVALFGRRPTVQVRWGQRRTAAKATQTITQAELGSIRTRQTSVPTD